MYGRDHLRWTPVMIADLKALWANEMLSKGEIARMMGISRSSLDAKAKRLDLPDRDAPPPPIFCAEPPSEHVARLRKFERIAAGQGAGAYAAQSALHLLALKRAGFRYGHGEHVIPPDDRPIRQPTQLGQAISYIGSPAAMVAGY